MEGSKAKNTSIEPQETHLPQEELIEVKDLESTTEPILENKEEILTYQKTGLSKLLSKVKIPLFSKRYEEYIYYLTTNVTTQDYTVADTFKLFLYKVGNAQPRKSNVIKSLIGIAFIGFLIGGTVYLKTTPYMVKMLPTGNANKLLLSSDSNSSTNMQLLSVGGLEVNSLTDVLGVLVTNIGYWDYLEFKKEKSEESTDRVLTIGDSIYTMEMKAYLAYKSYVGEDVPFKSFTKVSATTLKDNTLTQNSLLPDDIILSINGVDVKSTYDVTPYYAYGKKQPLFIQVLRGNKKMTLTTTLYYSDVEDTVTLKNKEDYKEFLKFSNIRSNKVDGNSAGLALALSYYSANKENITKGLHFGITGAIDTDGRVYPIGGIKYKVAEAIRDNLDFIFVPADKPYTSNTTDALIQAKKEGASNKLAIIPVNSLDEVIKFLEGVQKGTINPKDRAMK